MRMAPPSACYVPSANVWFTLIKLSEHKLSLSSLPLSSQSVWLSQVNIDCTCCAVNSIVEWLRSQDVTFEHFQGDLSYLAVTISLAPWHYDMSIEINIALILFFFILIRKRDHRPEIGRGPERDYWPERGRSLGKDHWSRKWQTSRITNPKRPWCPLGHKQNILVTIFQNLSYW